MWHRMACGHAPAPPLPLLPWLPDPAHPRVPPCSQARPHPRVFCAYVFTSLLGQFAIYISFLMFMQHRAHAIMPKVSCMACMLCCALGCPDAQHALGGSQCQSVGCSGGMVAHTSPMCATPLEKMV